MKSTGMALIGALLLTAGVSSCSKSYNCHCIYKTNGAVTNEDDNTISEGSKSKSAAKCDEMDNTSTQTVGGNTYTSSTECELKD